MTYVVELLDYLAITFHFAMQVETDKISWSFFNVHIHSYSEKYIKAHSFTKYLQ